MALETDQLMTLTLAEMNDGLRSYREDLRYSREDAVNFAKLWNAHKLSTIATVITADGFPCVIVVDA